MRGYNAAIKKLRKFKNDITVTTVLFDDELILFCNGEKVESLKKLNYQNGGATAAFDAVGCTIDFVQERKNNPKTKNPNANVLFFIVTDGYENASRIFNNEQITRKVELTYSRTDQGIWTFVLMGAININAERAAREIAVDQNKAQMFVPNKQGYEVLFESFAMAFNDVKRSGYVEDDWKDKTGQLKVGGLRISDIKNTLSSFEYFFECMENGLGSLEQIASRDGLSQEFEAKYTEVKNYFDTFVEAHKKITGKGVVKTIVRNYIVETRRRFDQVRQLAITAQIDRLLNANEIWMSGIVTAPEGSSIAEENALIAKRRAQDASARIEIEKNLRKAEEYLTLVKDKNSRLGYRKRMRSQRARNNSNEPIRYVIEIGENKPDALQLLPH